MRGVSLVLATLGRTWEVERFIAHLAKQSCQDFELIVVDQNQDDRLAHIVDEARYNGMSLRHLRQEDADQCKARNLGLSIAALDWVAFPDDDCWYEPDVIEKVLRAVDGHANLQGVVARWEEVSPVGGTAHRLSNSLWREFREVDASCITQFFSRSLLIQLGGFDARLGLHSWFGGGEETDLMFRALASGAAVAYVPDIVVHHAHGQITAIEPAALFRRARSRARGTGGLYAKHSLSPWVIGRGLLSPLLRALASLHNPRMAAIQLGQFLGRFEGWRAWPSRAGSGGQHG